MSSATIHPKPALEVDGKRRAIWVSLDRSIDDVQDLYNNGRYTAEDWRHLAGQAFTDALRETFVVVNRRGNDVLELRIKRADLRIIIIDKQLWAQVDFQASLEDAHGVVLARAVEVVRGPVPASDFEHVDLMVTSAIEEFVRRVASKTLPSIPETFPASSEQPLTVWLDSAVAREEAPAAPPKKARTCVADQLPEWSQASAAEKKALLKRCE